MVEIISNSTYSEERARDFFRFHLFKVNPMKYVYFGAAGLALIIALIFLIKMILGMALFFLSLAGIIIVVRLAVNSILVNRIIKKIYFKTPNYVLKLNEDKINYQDSSRDQDYLWEDLIATYQTKNYYYFYVDKANALVLPKHTITDEELENLDTMITNSNIKYRKMRWK